MSVFLLVFLLQLLQLINESTLIWGQKPLKQNIKLQEWIWNGYPQMENTPHQHWVTDNKLVDGLTIKVKQYHPSYSCFVGCILRCSVAVCCCVLRSYSRSFHAFSTMGDGKWRVCKEGKTIEKNLRTLSVLSWDHRVQAGGCSICHYRTNSTELADKDSVTNLFSSWASSDAAYWQSMQPLYWREWPLQGNRWWPQCQPPPVLPVRGPPLSPEEESNLQRQSETMTSGEDTVGLSHRNSTVRTTR